MLKSRTKNMSRTKRIGKKAIAISIVLLLTAGIATAGILLQYGGWKQNITAQPTLKVDGKSDGKIVETAEEIFGNETYSYNHTLENVKQKTIYVDAIVTFTNATGIQITSEFDWHFYNAAIGDFVFPITMTNKETLKFSVNYTTDPLIEPGTYTLLVKFIPHGVI